MNAPLSTTKPDPARAPAMAAIAPLGPIGSLGEIRQPGTAAGLALHHPAAGPTPERRREFAPNATIAGREDLTPSVARFFVRPDGPIPQYEPGQYFSIGLPTRAGMLLRPYSTASPRGTQDALEFLVRRVPTGSFTPSLWRATIGDRAWIGPPKGLFRLIPKDPRTHLLVSSGTGIAPFISMLNELLDRDGTGDDPVRPEARSGPRVVVAHGVSYAAELAYRERLENTAAANPRFTYVPTVSRPSASENDGWPGRTGRVESILDDVCAELRLDPANTIAYLCGNPEMIATSREALCRLGLRADAIIHENYWAAPGV
jgi:ferredoxin/flavodoxin---NADP+ reductase